MKNYRESDYALNKYNEGIVYRFADKTVVVITMEDYLHENPDKTEQDFLELKALSDEMYLEQARADAAQGNKLVSIHGLEETELCSTTSVDEEYMEREEHRRLATALDKLFRDGKITEKQKRRFTLHYIGGKTFREIAASEGTHCTTVEESAKGALEKLRKYFAETK